jgi:RNA polymerase sigma factor (sigma-70 family)
MDRSNWNDEQLAEAIREGAGERYEAALEYMYHSWKTAAVRFLKKNGAFDADIECVFDTGLEFLVRRVNSDNFTLAGPLENVFQNAITDAWVLEGLPKAAGDKHRDAAFIYLNDHLQEVASKAIESLGGNEAEAEEAYVLAFSSVYDRLLKSDFVLKSGSINAYFRRAVENRWRDMRKRKVDGLPLAPAPEKNEETLAEEMDRVEMAEKDKKALLNAMTQLDERCRKILTCSIEGVSSKQMAALFGWKNAQIARNETNKCWEKLKKWIPLDLVEKFKPKKGRPRK